MNIQVQVKLEWDKAKEPLSDFKVKYEQFRKHIESMQIKGMLPRNKINWVITSAKPS